METVNPPFELCEVCNLNHDNGRRHKYLTSHRRNLSGVLYRFQTKIADVRFFLHHPSLLRSEHCALNRLWCVFCALDILELDSSFTCSNAIEHLSGEEHLKKLKDFMWRHGGGMDRVDSFRVSEADLIKWKKSCSSLKSAGSLSSEGTIGPQLGPLKDIQNELTANHTDSFQKSTGYFNSCVSNAVMPLQSLTYKEYRLYEEISGPSSSGHPPHVATSIVAEMKGNAGPQYTHSSGSQPKRLGNNGEVLHSLVQSVRATHEDQRTGTREDSTQANVHTGALPPWFEASQEEKKSLLNEMPDSSKHALSVARSIKSKKLNPKRVGAAWAERRRVELEMEKRGEVTPNGCDANWLPNFGRVWQAGTRKESKKEFAKEKRKLLMDETQPEIPLKIKPYISKRMQVGSHNNDGGLDTDIKDFTSTS